MNKALEFLLEKPNFKEFVKEIQSESRGIQIENTTEETGLFLVQAAFNKSRKSIVIVAPNLYHAQMIYDKLSITMKTDEVLFFPQDEFITSEMLVSSWEFRIERINTIKNILKNKRIILVTHLPGILKPQLSPNRWKSAIFSLISGHEISIEKLANRLFQLGYSKEYTVEKMGDYSIRGGIVDIFPLGEKSPVRLDFFGELIEKIKMFDIESQRSSQIIDSIEILPMTEFFFNENDYLSIQNEVNNKLSSTNIAIETNERIMDDLSRLSERNDLDRLKRYISFLPDNKFTILDFLPNKLVFFFNYGRVIDQYKLLQQDLSDWFIHTSDYAKMGFSFFYPLEEIEIIQPIFLNYLIDISNVEVDKKFSFTGNEPLKFDGNLNLLIQQLKENSKSVTTLISVRSSKSRIQLTDLLSDSNIEYCLIGNKDTLIESHINIIISDEYFDYYSDSEKLIIITENAIQRKQVLRKKGQYVSVYENSKRLSSINDLKHGDYVVHYDYGIGRFLDIKTIELGNTLNDYIHIEYRDGDKLYIPIESFSQIQKYAGSEGFMPRLSKLGGADWSKTKQRVRNKAKDIADKLIQLYSLREKSTGFSFSSNPDMELDLETDFPFVETRDQLKAINEVFSDMELAKPMDRLLCGDVGFGKTEIALRAAFRAVLNNKQVAYLAPTTVLSKQHYQTFSDRLNKFGVNVVLLNRFVSKKQQHEILDGLRVGTIDILIGTHRILSQDIVFHDLGLLVIDEEQRFGVQHKEKIKEMKVNVDVLSLSATPIPRTLQMAIMGVKNMSLLETAPENRYPIQTYVLERNDTIVKDAIERELARKGQTFYLYNRIDDIEDIAMNIQKSVPEAKVAVAHGQMHKHELESVIDDFIDQKIDVLVSTTIIETGIDIPNANTLIIHDSDRLGLAQLYQIRGRVGRSNRIAYAYLMFKKNKILTEEAEKRLKVIKEFTELGSGFKIAIRDLSIRGAGDILGSEQSGFIDSVGIDLYMKILEEEIHEKQGLIETKEPKSIVKATVSRYIDEKYIEDDFVKIEMHNKINAIEKITDIEDLLHEFKDRFGEYEQELEIYMYERLFEKLSAKIKSERLIESKTNVTLSLSESASKTIAGDKLFSSGIEISKFIRFAYRNRHIQIILDTVGLERHWLYTMVEFLEKIT